MLSPWLRRQALAVAALLPCHTLASLSSQAIHDDLVSLLSSNSQVVFVSDVEFTEDFTPRYNVVGEPIYVIGVKPAMTDDVQKVVQYAVGNNISLLATGGGHGYSPSLSRMQGGIDLDLGFFNSVQVNIEEGTMTVGASARASDVATVLQEAGMEITVPQCPCVGFAGASLGGGLGPYSGLYGPISDSLISAEVIISNGSSINASQTDNTNLFYGLKGAGSNYGIATSLTYQVYPATNHGESMNADMTFPASQNESVWNLTREFASTQPKELSIGLSIRYSTGSALEGIIITANFIYAGPEEDGKALIQPFLDLQPLGVNISTVLWKDIPSVANGGAIVKYGCTPGVYYVPFGVNLYEVDVPNLVAVVNRMDEALSTNATLQGASIVWQQYSQYGFQLSSQDSSAYPYRDVVSFVQIDGIGASETQTPALTEFGREMRDLLHQGSGREELDVYVHFAHGDEDPASWFSAAKLPTLIDLKAKYDPSNIFQWYNPVLSTS